MWDTIAAIATGEGLGAVGIVRVSGTKAESLVKAIFVERNGRAAADFAPRKLYYGTVADEAGRALDHCLCTVSRAPQSYTGEDTAEFHCHGSSLVLAAVLQALFAAGARQARPGEFTERAFLNGKLDLTEAEAVIDLIRAETIEAAQNAVGQLGGAVSTRTDAVYDGIGDILAHFHAVLDYPDEDIEPFELLAYQETLAGYIRELTVLAGTFRRGQIMTRGVPTAILGRPNVGKSSLLNALLGYERAIVTDIPGTTRDTLEERVMLGGTLLRLVDTAGLRETTDPVERLGVERTVAALEEAELALVVFDGAVVLTDEDFRVIDLVREVPHCIAVISKSDLPAAIDEEVVRARIPEVVYVSAVTGAGLDDLEIAVSAHYAEASASTGQVLTNPRHVDAVSRAVVYLRSAQEAMDAGVTPDAVLTDLEGAMEALGGLTGRTVSLDVTSRIFERFCVGK
ncbi:MAG: tRNA uridine-5-carboxymethylaminomethyl(34) synthesis GTPase MnmE [Oscillospiraceae bacterium]|nr:tRNA uridine-5-carboxymethylaminomethyl(34) synthesis GTPase MnmE [Oscillospiraceae bacterium]